MTSTIVLFCFALVSWAVLNWPPGVQELLVGLSAAAFVAFLTGDIFIERPRLLGHAFRYGHFVFRYIPLFTVECLKANIDVARRVLHPALPLRPGVVVVKTCLKSDVALTFLANSITLTPGTMAVDVDRDSGTL